MRAGRSPFSIGRALDDPPRGTVAGPWNGAPDGEPFALILRSRLWSITWHNVTLPDPEGLLHRGLRTEEDEHDLARITSRACGWEISLEGLALPTGTGELMEVRRESPAPDTQE